MAGFIPREQADEILERNDILSVVQEYVKLKRSGANYTGLCPFHNEKTPSFSVNPAKGIFKCFGCGKGGGAAQFIMAAENLDYNGALQFLAKRAGIEIHYEGGPDVDRQQKLRQDVLALNNRAQQFFKAALKRSAAANSYIERRALSAETVEKFGIGFAPDDWDQLTNICTRGALAVTPELMAQAGLSRKRPNGDGYYDYFRNRLMFPVFDEMGNIVAFGGRVMDDSKPKYLNTSDTAAYSKGHHLYGLNFARKSGQRRVIMVEGYMDCIALHQKGIDWTVASLGTALTQGQARLLKKYFDEVYIGYDSDAAGQNATVRGLDILEAQGLKVRVLRLGTVDPEVKDPDEFLRKHPVEDFMKVLDRAETLVEFKIRLAATENPPSDPVKLPDFLRKVVRIIAREPSASVRSIFIADVAENYGVDQTALTQDVDNAVNGGEELSSERVKTVYRRVKTNSAANSEEKLPELSQNGKTLDRLEKRLLVYMTDDPKRITELAPQAEEKFVFESNKSVANKLQIWYIEGYAVTREALLNECGPDEAGVYTDEFEFVGVQTKAGEIIDALKKCRFKYLYEQLSHKLGSTSDAKEKASVMKELSELIRSSRD